MPSVPPIPVELWNQIPPAAQAAILALVQQYERRLQSLQEQVAQLTERLNQNSTNSSRPPSSDPPHVKRRPPKTAAGRKRGGQPGHARQQRPLVPPEQVKQSIPLMPSSCRKCGQALHGEDPQPRTHQVAEIPPVQAEVTEYRLHRLTCTACGTRTCASLPAGVPTGAFGPRLQALLAVLAGGYRLGKRPIRQLAHDLFGLSISTGMVAKLERSTAEALQQPMSELEEYVRTQPANVDETSWREAGQKAWLWVVVTPFVAVFHIAATRCGKVARGLLGWTYRQVVTSDRWKAYNQFRRHQFCWSHLRRDFQAMIDRQNSGAAVGKMLLDLSDQMFAWWHRVRDGTLRRSSFQVYVSGLRAEVSEALTRGAACGCSQTAATCRDLLAHEPKLWAFVWHEGVEPTNNAAERALRHAVLWRRGSGGTNSSRGSRFVERVLSVRETCRQQGRGLLDFLVECCQARLEGGAAPCLLPQGSIGVRARTSPARKQVPTCV
jgi:transposase